jgi:hypothetical protein
MNEPVDPTTFIRMCKLSEALTKANKLQFFPYMEHRNIRNGILAEYGMTDRQVSGTGFDTLLVREKNYNAVKNYVTSVLGKEAAEKVVLWVKQPWEKKTEEKQIPSFVR